MFDKSKVSVFHVPRWEAVFRAELVPGVVSIIAVHDTTRGRALGGCRMWHYTDEAQALTDVLRLSRGMTFKNAISDLPLGGGKAIIICDPNVAGEEREQILLEFGKFVDFINDRREIYCTAEDMNTTVADMKIVSRSTDNIFGTTVDPSPFTAWGVFCAAKKTAEFFADDLFGGDGSLGGKRILIQGIGKVGHTLADLLHQEGAHLFFSDVRQESVEAAISRCPGAVAVPPQMVYDQNVDIFMPCARGEVVTVHNVDKVRFKILCGAANNQLAATRVGGRLQDRGIVYCPDYIANMGGVCSIQFIEIEKMTDDQARAKISDTVDRQLEQTYRTGFEMNLAFNQAVDYVVKKVVWGEHKGVLTKNNRQLFPKAAE